MSIPLFLGTSLSPSLPPPLSLSQSVLRVVSLFLLFSFAFSFNFFHSSHFVTLLALSSFLSLEQPSFIYSPKREQRSRRRKEKRKKKKYISVISPLSIHHRLPRPSYSFLGVRSPRRFNWLLDNDYKFYKIYDFSCRILITYPQFSASILCFRHSVYVLF